MMLLLTLASVLPLALAVAESPSPPPQQQPRGIRHSYSQYIESGSGAAYSSPEEYARTHSHPQSNAHPNAGRYGFEDATLAAHYSNLAPKGHAHGDGHGNEVSPTWLDEMAVMAHVQQAQQDRAMEGDLMDGLKGKTGGEKKPAEPFPPVPYPPYIVEGNYWGIRTFAHLPPTRCTSTDNATRFDVAILGCPFDTATSWRPGARFGPSWIRHSSQRIGGANRMMDVNPFSVLKVVDCGDSRMSFYSNDQALKQLEDDYKTLLDREVATAFKLEERSLALDGKHHPRIFMLGGDHTIVLPALRGLAPIYGPITVIHFDSHCDSRHPRGDPLTHGDYFYFAHAEGLLANNSIHAGIRVPCDEKTDHEVGFTTVTADEIEDIGWKGVIKRIKDRVGDSPVYITMDIDTLDPAFAPSTGTPEIGGWTTREFKKILHGLRDLRIVGGDVVEVIESYDGASQITGIAAAGLAFEVLSMMALTPLVGR